MSPCNMFRALSAFRRFATAPELIKVENIGKVQLITLNRPKALNALNTQLLNELTDACNSADVNPAIGAIVITGSEKAFAAGADIKEMAPLNFVQVYMSDLFRQVSDLSKIRKPMIAAVNGLALGGGCELAMICDIILAGDSAKFGQPEIALGTIPGVGGTQRLTRAIGKSRAMELILTGEQITAQEAVQRGLASRVVPKEKLVEEAVETAKKITRFSLPVVLMAKECINRAFETTLEEGLNFERRMFFSTFALEDRKEGVAAFIEKRQPVFKDK